MVSERERAEEEGYESPVFDVSKKRPSPSRMKEASGSFLGRCWRECRYFARLLKRSRAAQTAWDNVFLWEKHTCFFWGHIYICT